MLPQMMNQYREYLLKKTVKTQDETIWLAELNQINEILPPDYTKIFESFAEMPGKCKLCGKKL